MQSYFNQVTENLGEENFEKTLNTKKLQWFDHVTFVFGTVLISLSLYEHMHLFTLTGTEKN